MPLRQALTLLIKIAVTGAVIFWLLMTVSVQTVISEISSINQNYIPLILLLFVVQILFSSERQRVAVNLFCGALGFWSSFKIAWISAWFGQLFISFLGSDAVRVLIFRNMSFSLASSLRAVMTDRFAGLVSHVGFVLATLPFLLPLLSDPLQRWGLIFFAASLTVGFCCLLFAHYLIKIPFIPSILLKAVVPVADTTESLMRHGGYFTLISAHSVVINILNLVIFYVIGLSLSASLNFVDIVILLPTILLVSLLPISFAGWGLREGTMVTGLALVNVPSETALSISLLFGIFALLIYVPGSLLWFKSSNKQMSMNDK